MNYTDYLKKIGDESTDISSNLLSTISEKLGIDSSNLPIKIMSIFVLLVVFYLSLSISKKLVKFALMVVSIILIIAIFFSILNSNI